MDYKATFLYGSIVHGVGQAGLARGGRGLEIGDAFLAKARESLAGASSELINGRYNNVANRAYYAVFQAAVVALDRAGIRPSGARDEWSHRSVQAMFPQLVTRHKRYPTEIRSTLGQLLIWRERADYALIGVSETQARRAVARARVFVSAIAGEEIVP